MYFFIHMLYVYIYNYEYIYVYVFIFTQSPAHLPHPLTPVDPHPDQYTRYM
jgi:hypothetical protein